MSCEMRTGGKCADLVVSCARGPALPGPVPQEIGCLRHLHFLVRPSRPHKRVSRDRFGPRDTVIDLDRSFGGLERPISLQVCPGTLRPGPVPQEIAGFASSDAAVRHGLRLRLAAPRGMNTVRRVFTSLGPGGSRTSSSVRARSTGRRLCADCNHFLNHT